MRRMSYACLRSFHRVLVWRALFWWVMLIPRPLLAADTDHCAVCGEIPFGSVYLITDAVTLEKVAVCTNCEALYPNCFLCGLPAKTNAVGYLASKHETGAPQAAGAVVDQSHLKLAYCTRSRTGSVLALLPTFVANRASHHSSAPRDPSRLALSKGV